MTSKKPPSQGVREIVYFLTSANSYTVVHTFVLDILKKAGQNNPMGIIGSVVWQVKAFIAYIYCPTILSNLRHFQTTLWMVRKTHETHVRPLLPETTVKPVYNDHLMGYLSAFWSSTRWPRATQRSSRRQILVARVNWHLQSLSKHITE